MATLPPPGPGENKPTAQPSSSATGTAAEPDILDLFWDDLPRVVNTCRTNKLWGVTLNTQDRNHAPTKVILKKFLKLVKGDIDKARMNLINAVSWNQAYVVDDKLLKFTFPFKFKHCSFVTCHRPVAEDGLPVVVMWNPWGRASYPEKEFYRDKNDEFYPWRMAMMEFAIRFLRLDSITQVPRYEDPDPYTITQDKITDGHGSFEDFYPGIFGQVEICGVGPVLRKTINSIVGDNTSKNKRTWHLVEKRTSVGRKYLPPVRDPYPDEYTGNNTGFKLHFGYTLYYQARLGVPEPEADSGDEEWDKFVAHWDRRYEQSAWLKEKYHEVTAAGYYFDEKGVMQRHDIPGLPDIDWTTTLKEKLKWDPKPKPPPPPVDEEEEGADIKGKGKEKQGGITEIEAEDPELDREVPTEEIETTDSSDAGKKPRFSFESGLGNDLLTLKDPKEYVPPSPPEGSGSGPSKVKEEQPQQYELSSNESTSSSDIYNAEASGATAKQMEETRQDLSAKKSDKQGSEESLRKYWSSDESEHWKNIKEAKMPRAQAKKQQQELEAGQPSSSEEAMSKKPATSSPGTEAQPPKMYSIFDNSSSSGDEGPQPSSSTQPEWKFTLDPPPPPHSDADESASVYSQDDPTPNTFGQAASESPQRSSSPDPESKAKALMEYIKPPDTNISGEGSAYTHDPAQAQTSSEDPVQLETGYEEPEEEPEEDSDSDSDESLNESSSD